MGVPEALVAVGSIGVYQDFDVGELSLAEFGVDFDVAEVTFPYSDHGKTTTI